MPGGVNTRDWPSTSRRTRHSCATSAIWCAEPAGVTIDTANVDPEIATLAGPQLVVPVSNARYALNAANARWVSLYDALYGTDALLPLDPADARLRRDPRRTGHCLRPRTARRDRAAGQRLPCRCHALTCHPERHRDRSSEQTAASRVLRDTSRYVGWRGTPAQPTCRAAAEQRPARRNRPSTARIRIGSTDPAGVADLLVEAAITTIQDCEDSVAAVDAARQGRHLPQLARPHERHA